MRNARWIRDTSAGVTVVLLSLVAAPLHAADVHQWAASAAEVRVLCPLTIGGSFEAKTSSLTGRLSAVPGATVLTGELQVNLKTLDTGISLRNRHMLENYLEVQKGPDFEDALLSDIDIGTPAQDLADGQRPFRARLRLHGTTQAVAGVARLSVRGSGVRVEASFPVRISDYGIAEPRHLGIGVKNEVAVHVVFLASAVTAEGATPLGE